MIRILIVHDERNLSVAMKIVLEENDHAVEVYCDVVAGLHAILERPPDLAIIGNKMPKLNGLDILREIRISSDIPVILLTSSERYIGSLYNAHPLSKFPLKDADDYILKPFTMQYLRQRVEAVLVRAGQIVPSNKAGKLQTVKYGKLSLDPCKHVCAWDGKEVPLTISEFLVLMPLAQRAREAVSADKLREKLKDRCWGIDDIYLGEIVEVIRHKLFEAGCPIGIFETNEECHPLHFELQTNREKLATHNQCQLET